MTSRFWVVAVAIASLTACKEPAPLVQAPKPAVKPVEPVKVAKSDGVASVSGQSDPTCIGPVDLGVPQKLTIGGRPAELNGYKLTFQPSPEKKDQPVVFGVLAGMNEDSGENLVNLRKFVEFFKAEKIDAVIVDGDTGESIESITRGLVPLVEMGLPTFVVIGNRECCGHFNDALAAMAKTSPNVVNLNKVRHVEFGSVDLISLPGYHDKRYLHCPVGCQYFKQDVDALKPIAKAAKNPVVFVSHGPPRGTTPNALDAATEAGNVGDINLNALVAEGNIPFGVFANIKEAGGRATDLDGTNVVKQDVLADKLYLNPGAADAVAWAMNDGTQSVGMAATLTVQGKQARYKIFRAKPLTAEEKAQAAKLTPAKDEAPAPKDAPDPAPKK